MKSPYFGFTVLLGVFESVFVSVFAGAFPAVPPLLAVVAFPSLLVVVESGFFGVSQTPIPTGKTNTATNAIIKRFTLRLLAARAALTT
jgi:hypothetical protein